MIHFVLISSIPLSYTWKAFVVGVCETVYHKLGVALAGIGCMLTGSDTPPQFLSFGDMTGRAYGGDRSQPACPHCPRCSSRAPSHSRLFQTFP